MGASEQGANATEGRWLVIPRTLSFVRNGEEAHFAVTDLVASVPVRYVGALPDLFREGQGVVIEGRVEGDLANGGWFAADTVLAKHDERYMPREAVEALKEAGQWRPEGTEP